MRITSKGQVTIPVDIREQAGLLPNTEVDFEFDGASVRIFKVSESRGRRETRGQAAVRKLRKARLATGPRLSTDEIMELTRGE